MTTLSNKQSQFLTNYSMLILTEDVDNKLKALKETDEWKNAIDEAKKDQKNLDDVEKEKKRLNAYVRFNKIKKELEILSEITDTSYVLAYLSAWDNNSLQKGNPFNPTNIDERLEDMLNNQAERDARNKTGFVTHFSSYGSIYGKLYAEIRSRLSITNISDFDEISEAIVSKFNTDELVKQIVEDNKSENSEDIDSDEKTMAKPA